MKVPAFLLNRTLRFLVLRLIWVSAIVNLGATVYYLRCPGSTKSTAQHVLLVSAPVTVGLHHILDAFLGVPWLIEPILEAAEIACIGIILKGDYKTTPNWQYQPDDFWLRVSTYWILVVSLFFLILIRLAWLKEGWSRGARPFSRMDIRAKFYENIRRSAPIESSSSIDVEKVGLKNKVRSTWALSAGTLAGRSIWRKQIAGEPRSLALSRGILFLVFLGLLLGVLFSMAVMNPIKELAMTPSKVLLMKAIPWGMPPLTEDNKWIIRVKQPKTKNNMMYSLTDAVKVYPLWEEPSQPSPTPGSRRRSPSVPHKRRQAGYSTMPMPSQLDPPSSAPPPPPTSTTTQPSTTSSTRTRTRTTDAMPTPTPTISASSFPLVASAPPCLVISSNLESVIFQCPARQQIPKESLLNALDTNDPSLLDQAFPDLLVVIDFAALSKSIEQPLTDLNQISVRHHSVHVALALTDNVDEINEFIPVTLVPGMNLLGITDLIMRQRSTQPVLSTLGWPDLFNTSMAAELAYVVNDPHATFLDLPPGPNIATIRFSARNKATAWRVKQDARDQSVLSGLSAVGGLGSLLGTVFLFLFGSSLLGIMFGMKPLSPFGLVHNFWHSEIAQGSQERYASLHTDIERIYDESGVMKYLFDMLIDIDLVVKAIVGGGSNGGGNGGYSDSELEAEQSPRDPLRNMSEVESDNEADDGVHPQSANSTQPLMNESRRGSS